MIYILQLYLIACTLFLAGKDASSYLLSSTHTERVYLTRVKRWHRDGVILWLLYVTSIAFRPEVPAWKTAIAALLIRLFSFDLAFNRWASLPMKYLGGTAWADTLFVRVFGKQGAVRKSLTFFIIWVVLNLLNQFL